MGPEGIIIVYLCVCNIVAISKFKAFCLVLMIKCTMKSSSVSYEAQWKAKFIYKANFMKNWWLYTLHTSYMQPMAV